jgi:hypothetical protein
MSKKRKYIALKRYGKIVSLLVKEFKQKNKGKKSDIKKIRKRASEIYGNFTSTPLSKITKKSVVSAKKVARKPKKTLRKTITADMLKDTGFLPDTINFWDFPEVIINIGKQYPHILVNVKTNKRDKSFQGIKSYTSLKDFLEEVREDAEQVAIEEGISESSVVFTTTPAYIKGKKKIPENTFVSMTFEGEEPTSVPKTPTIEPEAVKLIKETEEKIEGVKKKKKKKLKKLTKAEKKAKKEEEKKKEEKAKETKKTKREKLSKDRKEIQRQKNIGKREDNISDVIKLIKDKVITAKEGATLIREINKTKLKRGGKIK